MSSFDFSYSGESVIRVALADTSHGIHMLHFRGSHLSVCACNHVWVQIIALVVFVGFVWGFLCVLCVCGSLCVYV